MPRITGFVGTSPFGRSPGRRSLGEGGLPPAICAIAVLLLAGPALAANAAYSIQITPDSAAVRDLLLPDMPTDGVGEDLLETAVLTGLQPGEQRLLTPAEIHLRLTELGIDPLARGWFWDRSLIITRRSQVVSADDLLAAGERAIRAQLKLHPGDRAIITPVIQPRSLLVPVGDLTLDTLVRPPRLARGLWIADITGIHGGESVLDCTLRYRLRVTGSVLVAARPLRRGEALSEEDVVEQTRDISNLRGNPFRSPEELIGRQPGSGRRAARAASAGAILTTDWIEPIPAVRRREFITIVARVGAVRATTRVLALADGAIGDIIRVRTDGRRQEFLARVSGPGRAEVIASP